MTGGAGKYDKEATEVRDATRADGVVVIVLGGDRGSGFSVQLTQSGHVALLADVLEQVARELRREAS